MMFLYLLCFGFGIMVGFLLFAVVDNKNSILVRLETARIENYNLKKDVKEKEGLINAFYDELTKSGVIDDAEQT